MKKKKKSQAHDGEDEATLSRHGDRRKGSRTCNPLSSVNTAIFSYSIGTHPYLYCEFKDFAPANTNLISQIKMLLL